jgi:hypothetical protein
MSDFKLKQDIEKYKRDGLDEKTAIIVACAVNGVPEKATDILVELGDEQAELRKCLNEMVEFSQQYFLRELRSPNLSLISCEDTQNDCDNNQIKKEEV